MENHFKKSLQKQKIKKRTTPTFSGPQKPREVCGSLFPNELGQAEQVQKRKSS